MKTILGCKIVNFVRQQRVSQDCHFVLFFFDLFAEQQVSDDWMFEGRNREQGSATGSNPIHDNMFNLCVTWASPFETGAQNGIEISARKIEGFKIEKWNEYNDAPRDMMMPDRYQTFKFFTGNNKRCANETVKDCRELWIFLAQCLWR